jgi:hypothetical protein
MSEPRPRRHSHRCVYATRAHATRRARVDSVLRAASCQVCAPHPSSSNFSRAHTHTVLAPAARRNGVIGRRAKGRNKGGRVCFLFCCFPFTGSFSRNGSTRVTGTHRGTIGAQCSCPAAASCMQHVHRRVRPAFPLHDPAVGGRGHGWTYAQAAGGRVDTPARFDDQRHEVRLVAVRLPGIVSGAMCQRPS